MTQPKKDTTVGGYFKASKILFGAFILGVINFGIVLLVLFFIDVLPLVEIDENLIIYLILGSLVLYVLMSFVGNSIFNRKTRSVKEEFSFSKKLTVYQEGKLVQAVTLETSALFAMVLMMLTNHIFFVVIAFLSLIQMIRVFPKKPEMITALNLSYSEQQKLNDPSVQLN